MWVGKSQCCIIRSFNRQFKEYNDFDCWIWKLKDSIVRTGIADEETEMVVDNTYNWYNVFAGKRLDWIFWYV